MILFFIQLRGELVKLFARKRTYIGFGAFLAMEAMILFLWQLPGGQRTLRHFIERNGGIFHEYFSGLTLALMMVAPTIFILGSLFLGLVGGDFVAKEVEDGTMRMTLSRPISRIRILAVKYCTCVIYTFALVLFVGLSALAAASLLRGSGGFFVMIIEEKLIAFFDFQTGLRLYLMSLPFLALSMLTTATLAFNLSCWNMKPAAATITAVCYVLIDWIFHFLPYFESYKPWMLTTHMSTWLNVFRGPIPWPQMIEDYSYLLGIDATLLVIAVVVFQQRDFKS